MWLAGKEQTAKVAFIPDRLVVLYSTHRPIFPWEKIGGGKDFNTTPLGGYMSKSFMTTRSIMIINKVPRVMNVEQVVQRTCQFHGTSKGFTY